MDDQASVNGMAWHGMAWHGSIKTDDSLPTPLLRSPSNIESETKQSPK